jgi:hypothetical protein
MSQPALPTVNRARFKFGMSRDEADYLVPFCPLLPTKCMSFPVGNGGDHLDTGDPRQEQLVRCRWVGQAVNPAAADFHEITLNDGTGVKDERCHVSDARG